MNDTRIQPYHWIEGIAQLLAQTLVVRLNQGAATNHKCTYAYAKYLNVYCDIYIIYIYIYLYNYMHTYSYTYSVGFLPRPKKNLFNLVPARARAPHNVCLGTLARARLL